MARTPTPDPAPPMAGRALRRRTRRRLAALNPGNTPLPGVDTSDGISLKEARTVRIARRRQKAKRIGQRAYRRYQRSQAQSTPPSDSV